MACLIKTNPIPKCIDELVIGTITPNTTVDILQRLPSGGIYFTQATSDNAGLLKFTPVTIESKQELYVVEQGKFIGDEVNVTIGADTHKASFLLEAYNVLDSTNSPITYATISLSIS